MALWGKTDTVGDIPIWLEDDANNTNKSNDKDNAVFLDLAEVAVTANRAKGLKTPGWNLYWTSHGGTRYHAEPIVVMKVTSGDAGDNDSIPNS